MGYEEVERAFPLNVPDKFWQEGMSLRDYFAARAMQGMLSSEPIVDRTKVDKSSWAQVAYEWSDAMLKAREQKGE